MLIEELPKIQGIVQYPFADEVHREVHRLLDGSIRMLEACAVVVAPKLKDKHQVYYEQLVIPGVDHGASGYLALLLSFLEYGIKPTGKFVLKGFDKCRREYTVLAGFKSMDGKTPVTLQHLREGEIERKNLFSQAE